MSEINSLISDITGKKIEYFFDKVNLNVSFGSPEAGLMRLVSYLYVTLFEGSSKINYSFVEDRLESIQGNFLCLSRFKKLIHTLRTVQQHNVDIEKPEDKQKIYAYEDWLNDVVGKTDSILSKDWSKCSLDLLIQFEGVLEEIKSTLDEINGLEKSFREVVIEDWLGKLKNIHPIWKYKNLTGQVATNFGYENLDIAKFCQRHFVKWLTELAALGNYEFEDYALRQIERDFLQDLESSNLPLPITGVDIMSYFNLQPGTKVKELIMKARVIYFASPCTKEQLLMELKKSLSDSIISE